MTTHPHPLSQDLARLCLDHVAREEAHLDATRASLERVRAVLVGNDAAALEAALDEQDLLARRSARLASGRAAFRQAAADLLGLSPSDVTLDLLAGRLDAADGERLSSSRLRLRRLAAEVDGLNRRTASLVACCLDFVQRFLRGLTGEPADGRYGPDGCPRTAAGGSLIDARG